LSKKDDSCEIDTINNKVSGLQELIASIDAFFAYLNIDHPTDDEKKKTGRALWCS
jgi:hypothetical protein